jgi:hypothetical protein
VRSTSLPSWIKALAGLSAQSVAPHVFSVTGERLSYARVDRSGSGFSLAAWRSIDLLPETFQEGILGGPGRDPRLFSERLSELLRLVPGQVRQASLVLPDAWLRVAFTDGGDLPRGGAAREEVLRWKLKRLVPYRVDELRIRGQELPALGYAEAGQRVLLGFALEALLEQLESAFSAFGIRLGLITNAGLAALDALAPIRRRGLVALTLVADEEYSMVVAHDGDPVMVRHKTGGHSIHEGELVRRDLRLTRDYLEQQLPGVPVGSVSLLAPAEVGASWQSWLNEELGPTQTLSFAQLLPITGAEGRPLAELLPLVGAAATEVA